MVVRIEYASGPFSPAGGLLASHSVCLGAFVLWAPPADPLPRRYLRASAEVYNVLLPRFDGDKDALRAWLVRYGLGRLEAEIRSGIAPEDIPEDTMILQADVEHLPIGEKVCAFQSREPAGLICGAAEPKDEMRGLTSIPLCSACDLPDDRIRCSAFAHPQVRGYAAPSPHIGREVTGGLCDAGNQERLSEPGHCVPGGHVCWRRDIDVSPVPSVAPAADAGERVIDEFAYTRLALEKAGALAVKASAGDLTLARILLSGCRTESDFTTHVAALAGLLEQLDGRAKAKDIGEGTNDMGPLQALEVVLSQAGVAGHEGAIRALRDVPEIRRLAPVHRVLDTKGVAALGRFGISPPIADWDDAWMRVADRTRQSLRELRMAVEASSAPSGD